MARERNLQDPAEEEQAMGELEALLFAASRPLAPAFLARRLYVAESQAVELLQRLESDLHRPSRGLQLREHAGKWRLETKPEHDDVIASLRAERGEKPLTQQALESLAVIALRQPVTTEYVTAVRGIQSSASIETLRKRMLIAKTPNPGGSRGTSWRTTQNFLDLFSLGSLADLYRNNKMEGIFGAVLGDTRTTL